MSRAPSVWLHYDDHFHGDILHQSILVPHAGDTKDTYYCCMQWNAGQQGGGYCGIQDHPKGRAFIFSIWDPKGTHQPITPAYKGLWTDTANFGGEGTGLRSMNFSIGWRPDNWYSLVSRVWDVQNSTHFGFWIHDEGRHHWTHVVTMDFPVKGVTYNTSTGSFVEDWVGTGDYMRSAHYRHGFKRRLDGTWYSLSTAHFNVNQEKATLTHNNNYDAGAIGDYFYLTSGGHSRPSPGVGTKATFKAYNPAHPTEPPIAFSITSAKPDQVSWSVPATSTPQFSYTIQVNGHRVASEAKPEARSATLHGVKAGEKIEVTLQDILGNPVSRFSTIQQ